MKNKVRSYIIFSLAKEQFAISIKEVLRILEMRKITKIPNSPDYIMGIINLEGKALPIINSHVKFNLAEILISSRTNILVLEIIDIQKIKRKFGFVVDHVEEVIQLEDSQIKPHPYIGTKKNIDFIKGVFKHNKEHFIIVLNLKSMLSIDTLNLMNDMSTDENFNEDYNEIVDNLAEPVP